MNIFILITLLFLPSYSFTSNILQETEAVLDSFEKSIKEKQEGINLAKRKLEEQINLLKHDLKEAIEANKKLDLENRDMTKKLNKYEELIQKRTEEEQISSTKNLEVKKQVAGFRYFENKHLSNLKKIELLSNVKIETIEAVNKIKERIKSIIFLIKETKNLDTTNKENIVENTTQNTILILENQLDILKIKNRILILENNYIKDRLKRILEIYQTYADKFVEAYDDIEI